MSALSSRERVRRALNHQESDMVPVDIGASRISGISAIACRRLLDHWGSDAPVRIYDIKQQLALPSIDLVDRLGGDVVQVQRLGPTTGMPFLRIDRWKPGRMTDGSACEVPEAYDAVFHADGTSEVMWDGAVFARQTPGSLYFDVCRAPLGEAASVADIERYEWPDSWSDREEVWLAHEVREAEASVKAVFGGLPQLNSSFFEIGHTMFGYQRFMELLLTDRDIIERWLDRLLEHDFEILDEYLKVAGPYLDVIQMSDDFGGQDSLQISPRCYREIFKPRQRAWVEHVKRRTPAKVFLHCDGAIADILPDFIEVGIDIINPLQTSARGMEPQAIKQRFGRDLVIWGAGIDTQSTLPFGSLEEIRAEVRERIGMLAPGGGFVFGTIHNIQPDIPPEKIETVFQEARIWRADQRPVPD